MKPFELTIPVTVKLLVQCFTVIAIITGTALLALKSNPMIGVLFFIPFALGPLLVTYGLTFICHRKPSLVILLISAAAYLTWFLFVYMNAFYWHPDPQSPIALLFVGVYSLPVMLPLWLVAFWKRKISQRLSTNYQTLTS